MENLLPGGFFHNGRLEQRYSLKPLTGYTEMVFSDTEAINLTLPERVSEILTACVEKIGTTTADRAMIENLCVGDRQYLMRMIAIYMGHDELWLTSNCRRCSIPFDINVRQSEMPVKKAGHGYPYVSVETDDFKLKLRVPNGADQHKIAQSDVNENFEKILIMSSVIEKFEKNGKQLEDSLSKRLIGIIEQEVESIAPEVAGMVNVCCPECGAENHVRIDPYIGLKLVGKNIYSEVHQLAGEYHWSEQQILSLPKRRRKIYLDLIEKN